MMAARKYEMLTHKPMQQKLQPKAWYKERLDMKYLKPGSKSQFYNGKNWMFIKSGLDDFRTGEPPPIDESIILKPDRSIGPNITGSANKLPPIQQSVRDNLMDYEKHYSRIMPMQERREDHIAEIEYGLTSHPLALYPHLAESVNPETFETVVELLDPEMNLGDGGVSDNESQTVASSARLSPLDDGSAATTSRQQNRTDDPSTAGGTPSEHGSRDSAPHSYAWRIQQQEEEAANQHSAIDSNKRTEDEHITRVTREFCDWVADLGGTSNNIEESTVSSLFASGYETKPALSVPIHVVELTSVPPELRANLARPGSQASATPEMAKRQQQRAAAMEHAIKNPKADQEFSKFRYGAWYLHPREWRKLEGSQPLVDPKQLRDTRKSEAKEKSDLQTLKLADTHGSTAFLDYLQERGARKPAFLTKVEEIQRKAEEAAKIKEDNEQNRKTSRQIAQKPVEIAK